MVSPADQPDPYKQDAENQPTIQPLIGRNGGDSDSSLSETVPVKKRRLSRAPKACLSVSEAEWRSNDSPDAASQCRTRKRKCGGVQPIPCQFCVESNLTCEWPSLDGRASRTRRDPKGISVLSDGISARGSLNTGMQPADSGDWALAGDWLDNLDVLQDPLSHLVPLEQATNVSAQVSSSIVPAMTCDATFFSRLDAQRQVANFIPQDIFPPDFQWSPDFDPASLFFALSSQIPMVEEGSQHGMSPSQQYSVTSEFDPFTTALPRSRPDQQGEKTVKLIWWRPHGHTAIAPGLKRITLKVRVEKPSTRDATIPAPRSIEDIPSEVVDPDGMPKVAIMKHLLHLFMLHFGCQFPSLDRGQLEMDMELKRGSIFLLNSIAATASRQASAYLTDTDIRRPMGTSRTMTSMSGTVTPSSLVASNLWHNSARTIGDILVLSDIVDPFAYHALPFVNQAFFVAGSCYIKEVEQQQERNSAGSSLRSINGIDVGHPLTEEKKRETDLFRALLKTVASNNISTLQQGLAKQAVYWSGVAWVAQALEQRLSGVAAGAIDLGMVTENLTSFVSVPDAGVLGCGKFEPGLSSSSASEGTIS
ncbi:hypothetical protein P7C73_g2220, partial [Tremellales sp. Uapishka_1]